MNIVRTVCDQCRDLAEEAEEPVWVGALVQEMAMEKVTVVGEVGV